MDADPHGHAEPCGREFLEHLQVDLIGNVSTAVFLGIRQPEQPRFAEQAEGLARKLTGLFVLGGDRAEFAVGHVAGEFEEGLGFRVRKLPLDHRITCSSRGLSFNTMGPSEPHTTMSSILAPSSPDR